MARQQHRFHGDPKRFDVLAAYVHGRFGRSISYIADVAGGQGMLTRILNKKYNYECEVVDPRGWVLKGVPNRAEEFDSSGADYYDLVLGLHADEATRAVAEAALVRPTVLIPCCNFWSDERLGQKELLAAIELYYRERQVGYERVTFPFRKPKNIGLVTTPPRK
jgi:hypothetical protein